MSGSEPGADDVLGRTAPDAPPRDWRSPDPVVTTHDETTHDETTHDETTRDDASRDVTAGEPEPPGADPWDPANRARSDWGPGRTPGPDVGAAGEPTLDGDGTAPPGAPAGEPGADHEQAGSRRRRRKASRRRRPLPRVIAEYGMLAVFAIVLAFFIRTFVGLAFYIPSESMVPALKVHDRVIVTRVSYHLHDPRRGDIVVFDNPSFEEEKLSLPRRVLRSVLEVVGVNQPKDKNLIKRVVGLPGETLQGRNGRVYVDGVALDERYLPEGTTTSDFGPVTVPSGRYWMMGDNRHNSADSRYFGTIPRSSIVGRAFVRIWPPWRLALL